MRAWAAENTIGMRALRVVIDAVGSFPRTGVAIGVISPRRWQTITGDLPYACARCVPHAIHPTS